MSAFWQHLIVIRHNHAPYQLTNQYEICHRPTQPDTDKDIHKNIVNYFYVLMKDAEESSR